MVGTKCKLCGWIHDDYDCTPVDRPIVAEQQGGDWIPLWGFVDPPAAPTGYATEVERDCFLGFAISYRYVPIAS